MQEDLRFLAKLTKIKANCSYKVMADYIGINTTSFYNWLNGQYTLSEAKAAELKDFLSDLVD